MAKQTKANTGYHAVDMSQIDYEEKYRVGTRFVDALGVTYKYAKVDFGICGRDAETGKVYRDIRYCWFCVRL
ncbi:hypothetical protein LCGC14_1416910 [marine sediment metagenome]|uniref:Uncharacterized protein n=1 Tax=marine sediment metagenome TaxID=412755 RepID=A0A0F9M839_9ZZZZ